MNPQVKLIQDDKDILLFTLSGVNVSLANAVRRTMLSDIQSVVFKTTPNEENKANILVNTTRLNNEILKQRLSCIPIYIKDIDNFPYKNYLMELNVENTTDTTIVVTTKDFIVKDLNTGNKVDDNSIFPVNDYGYYIDFVRLRPKISDEIPGDKIHLTCEFSIGTSKEDGMFSAVSTCAYGYTVDEEVMNSVLDEKVKFWKNEGKTLEQIEFEKKNWKLLDGLRYTTPNSFDFSLQSIGVYSNQELLDKSCEILLNKMNDLNTLMLNDKLKITTSASTMDNCYDIVLENEDYTIGKTLEYFLYSKYFDVPSDRQIVTYCGFKKVHPHDSDSIIRVAFKQAVDKSIVVGYLQECIKDSIQVFSDIKRKFLVLTKN